MSDLVRDLETTASSFDDDGPRTAALLRRAADEIKQHAHHEVILHGNLSDEDLLARTLEARRAAHDAPLAEVYAENEHGRPTGKLKIRDHTRAWADCSREWMNLANEIDRRGLKQPEITWDGDSRR